MSPYLLGFYLTGTLAVLAGGWLGRAAFLRIKSPVPATWFYTLIAASSYMVVVHCLKLRTLHVYVDFSHWAQILHSICATGMPYSLNQEFYIPGTLNYFSIHFVPYIYVFAIPFKLFPYNETIVVFNYLLMVSSIVPLYKLALLTNKNKRVALLACTLLLWYPTFQYIVLYEFEVMRFSIPVLFWMFYFWECRKIPHYYACVILAILAREQLGLTIMMFGFYLLLTGNKGKHAWATMLVGLLGFLVITQWVMPSMGGSAEIGVPATGLIKEVLSNPVAAALNILNPIKFGNVLLLLLPLSFIPLLAPATLLGTAANLGGSLLSPRTVHSSY